MDEITLHELIDLLSRWVLLFTLLSILLPPVEFFEEFPRFQRWYRLGCKLIKYFGSLDWRGKVIALYPQFQKRKTTEGK